MAFQAPFKTGVSGGDSPSGRWVAVTTSDTVNFSDGDGACNWLYVGVSGNVVGIDCTGNAVTFLSMPIGLYKMRLTRINATNTTATNLIAGF